MTLRDKMQEWMNAVETIYHNVNAAQRIFNSETTDIMWSLEFCYGDYDPRRML